MPILCSKGLKMRVFKGKSAQKPRFCARKARKWGVQRVKAHKNPDFVLGDDCREPSSAHRSSALPATNPAECIWQQYARQQIAATYHTTCPVHAAGHTTVSKQPGYLLPLIPPWRYRLGATTKKLPPAHLSPCMLPQPAAKTYLPGTLPAAKTYLPANLPAVHTAEELPPGNLPAGAYYRAMGPAPSGRVIRM